MSFLFRSGFVSALVLMSSVLSAAEAPAVTVAGLHAAGPDLEVLFAAPPPAGATAALVDAQGNEVTGGVVETGEEGETRAVLAGALAAVAAHGPVYRVRVMDADGALLGSELPVLVGLRCAPAGMCRFQLLGGLAAPGTALVDPALGHALDALPAGTDDELAAVVAADPALRGAALTAAWYWASLPVAADGACGCVWTLEASLPGETGEGGAAAGVSARAVSREDGARVEQTRAPSLALRQRCAVAKIASSETVTVGEADGSWSTVLEIPRVKLRGCAAPCTPQVSWDLAIEGRSVAHAEGGPGATANASWTADVEVDGVPVEHLEDGASSVPSATDTAGDNSSRTLSWAGRGGSVALRATARAEIAAPGEPADVDAVAEVDWHLSGSGVSSCAQPSQVGVSAASPFRTMIPCLFDVPH